MKRIKMVQAKGLTFGEGCELYLMNCKQRNLREGTINHYRQSYLQFNKFFSPDMPLSEVTEELYNRYVLYLRETLHNDTSINSYLRDLITTFHFLMDEGHMKSFKMKAIKVDKTHVETYTNDELKMLLQKPDVNKCSYNEYQSWVMTSLLFSTGIRQRSMMNIHVKDIDFDNCVIYVNTTKNRKPMIVPMNKTLVNIMKEFLKYRQYKDANDWLFVNVYGQRLVRSTCYAMLYSYNKRRGVETTGIHRYRHTFAKEWILSGGNVVTLQKILGHSSLDITQDYINLLVSDVQKQVEEINLLDKYAQRKQMHMKR